MLDATDRTLLALLKQDTRYKYTELGKAVNLSAPSVYARVKKLEEAGIIRKYTIELEPNIVGLNTCAFIRIAISGQATCGEIVRKLQAFSEIEECHSIAGEDSLILKVRTSTSADLEPLLNRLRQISGIARTITSIVLVTHFERGTNL